jgi:polyvinyl alcohol dehydrogenase (cytochrome)
MGCSRKSGRTQTGLRRSPERDPRRRFRGGYDGILRAFSTTNGELLWQFNMVQEFQTVNGVAAKGGSMGGPGPTIAGGLLLVGSGYTFGERGTPGNALLAFAVE